MSDLTDLKDHLDGLVGDDPWFDAVEWVVSEIERLTEEINAFGVALHVVVKKRDEADARVEELEAAQRDGFTSQARHFPM